MKWQLANLLVATASLVMLGICLLQRPDPIVTDFAPLQETKVQLHSIEQKLAQISDRLDQLDRLAIPDRPVTPAPANFEIEEPRQPVVNAEIDSLRDAVKTLIESLRVTHGNCYCGNRDSATDTNSIEKLLSQAGPKQEPNLIKFFMENTTRESRTKALRMLSAAVILEKFGNPDELIPGEKNEKVVGLRYQLSERLSLGTNMWEIKDENGIRYESRPVDVYGIEIKFYNGVVYDTY